MYANHWKQKRNEIVLKSKEENGGKKEEIHFLYWSRLFYIIILADIFNFENCKGKIADIPENYKTNEEIIPNCNNIYNNNFYNNKK